MKIVKVGQPVFYPRDYSINDINNNVMRSVKTFHLRTDEELMKQIHEIGCSINSNIFYLLSFKCIGVCSGDWSGGMIEVRGCFGEELLESEEITDQAANAQQIEDVGVLAQPTKTSVIVSVTVEGCHNFPKAKELFPEVAFLSDRHRHMFTFKLSKEVFHDDRDVEFVMFKRDVTDYLLINYYDGETRCLEFGPRSCEMLSRELLDQFGCMWVECWEDNENGARIDNV